LLLLAELGFGLDLDTCAVSGAHDNLTAVSPRSGRAVSAAEAAGYEDRLLPLPQFVRSGGQGSWREIADGLRLTGHFLRRDLLAERWSALGEARERLAERLRRAGGFG
jgi:DNA repair protein RecO (recombination protein O)